MSTHTVEVTHKDNEAAQGEMHQFDASTSQPPPHDKAERSLALFSVHAHA